MLPNLKEGGPRNWEPVSRIGNFSAVEAKQQCPRQLLKGPDLLNSLVLEADEQQGHILDVRGMSTSKSRAA